MAATAAEEPETQSSEALTPPTLASMSSFPNLSRSAAPSLARPSSPTAPASGQGEVIAAGRAHSSSQLPRLLCSLSAQSQHMLANVAGRHAELNLEESEVGHIHSRFDSNCKSEGN